MLPGLRRSTNNVVRLALSAAIVAAGVTVMANPASASASITLSSSVGGSATAGTATATVVSTLSRFDVIFPSTFTSTATWPSSAGTCPAGLTFAIDSVTQPSPANVQCWQYIGGGDMYWQVILTGGANFAVGKVLTMTWNSTLLQNPTAAGTYTVNISDGGTSSPTYVPASVTITAAPAPSNNSGSGPSPILQQFGILDTDTCDGKSAAHLNWAGVADGGWGRSWAAWANDGRGGAVCTRTLSYDSGWARWTRE